jgi:ribosomal protein S21
VGGVRFPVIGRSSSARMKVELQPEETLESLLRRFKKGVALDGIIRTYREKARFATKREKQRRKAVRAARRRRRER